MAKNISLRLERGELDAKCVEVREKTFLVVKSKDVPEIPFVRLHSSCVFGEAFGAIDCDCGEQLRSSIDHIQKNGGILIYSWDEGRGLGIGAKIQAIYLQQTDGVDTAEAFARLGHKAEPRDFLDYVAALATAFDGKTIKLASNNPAKRVALESSGYTIAERVKLDINPTNDRKRYLEEKQRVLGHDSDIS